MDSYTNGCYEDTCLPAAGGVLCTITLILLTPLQFTHPLFKKNSCDIYEKGVTNSSKNSSVNFLHSISTKKIVCFEEKRIL